MWVLFRRFVQPLTAALGAGIVLEGRFQGNATGMDEKAVRIEQDLDLVEAVEYPMARPACGDPRAEDALEFAVRRGADAGTRGRGRVQSDRIDTTAAR